MIDRSAIDVKFFPVPEGLSDCLTTIYRIQVDLPECEAVSDALIPEWGNIRFMCDGGATIASLDGKPFGRGSFVATGPTSRPLSVALYRSRLWGFGLLPLGWASFVRTAASKLADAAHEGQAEPAVVHFAELAATLSDSAGDDWQDYRSICQALGQHARRPRDEERVRNLQEAMADPYLLHIPDFADRAGISVRTLERMSLKYFGFSPNVILRRQRLIRSLAAFTNDGEANWSEAIDRHYHDQPHFVREFHQFMGMSPSDYADRPHPIMRAFMENRQKVWGDPARKAPSPESVQASGA